MRRKSETCGLVRAAISLATLIGAPPVGAEAEVEVKRSGTHVLHRKGYFAQTYQPASRAM